MKNSIWKSFEDFVRTPASLLRGSLISIVNLKTSLTDKKNVSVEIMRNNIQINVVNSEKVYNLLSMVMHKRKMLELKRNAENQECKLLN